jgi:hypothetical protein
MSYFINSHSYTPGQNSHTQIEVNAALSSAAFRYFTGDQHCSAIGVDFGSVFLLRFSRLDLATKRMNWGYVDYRPRAAPTVDRDKTVEGKRLVRAFPATLPARACLSFFPGATAALKGGQINPSTIVRTRACMCALFETPLLTAGETI